MKIGQQGCEVLFSSVFRFLFGAALLCTSFSCLSQYTYYFSTQGSDSNDGLSSESPKRSLSELQPGNKYLLKRGDVFHTRIYSPPNREEKQTTLSSYGEGPLPIITTLTEVAPDAWAPAIDHVWRVDLSAPNSLKDSFKDKRKNVGYLLIDGVIWGDKRRSVEDLKAQWDFFSDSSSLYVYSSIDLRSFKKGIQFSIDGTLITLSSGMRISKIRLIGGGGHGIKGAGVSNVLLEKLVIEKIGGAYLEGFKDGTIRYGNGIEIAGESKNIVVRDNEIKDVYDAALTIQGAGSFDNIVFTRNTLSRNQQSFEFWVTTANSTIKDCKFIRNISKDAGFGWSSYVRSDKKTGVHLLSYFVNPALSGLKIENNYFGPARSGYLFSPAKSLDKIFFTSKNNKIAFDSNAPLLAQESLRKVNLEELQKAGLERGSSRLK